MTDNFEIVQGKSEYKFISSKYVAFASKMNPQMKAPEMQIDHIVCAVTPFRFQK